MRLVITRRILKVIRKFRFIMIMWNNPRKELIRYWMNPKQVQITKRLPRCATTFLKIKRSWSNSYTSKASTRKWATKWERHTWGKITPWSWCLIRIALNRALNKKLCLLQPLWNRSIKELAFHQMSALPRLRQTNKLIGKWLQMKWPKEDWPFKLCQTKMKRHHLASMIRTSR